MADQDICQMNRDTFKFSMYNSKDTPEAVLEQLFI